MRICEVEDWTLLGSFRELFLGLVGKVGKGLSQANVSGDFTSPFILLDREGTKEKVINRSNGSERPKLKSETHLGCHYDYFCLRLARHWPAWET